MSIVGVGAVVVAVLEQQETILGQCDMVAIERLAEKAEGRAMMAAWWWALVSLEAINK